MMVAMSSPGAIALVSSDLMFASQISTTMRRAGGSAVLVTGDAVPEVDVVFVDLNTAVDERLALIARLREGRPDLDIVWFCHHAERELRRRARSSGATRVINNGALQAVALRLSGVSIGKAS
jgi:CheY-like chemotaxis protein